MSVVDIVFACINFAVLGVFGWWVVVNHVLPGIAEKLGIQSKTRQTLAEGIDKAAVQIRELREKKLQQELFCTELDRKAALWRKSVSAEEARIAAERETLTVDLVQRYRKQEEQHEFELLTTRLLPQVVSQARESLSHAFADDQTKKAYIDEIVHKIQDSILKERS